MGAVFVCEVAAMEVSQKKPAAGAPAAKEPAPTLASGKYTFSKAEALRRYVLRKQNKSGKGVSVAKRAEKKLKAQYVEKPFNKGTRVVSLKKRPNNYPVKEEEQGSQASWCPQSPQVFDPRNRSHSVGWCSPWKEGRPLEIPEIWSSPRHWSIQDQPSSSSSCPPTLRYRHQHQAGH